MKFIVDQEEVLDLATWQENLIKNDIASSLFEADMKRRVSGIILHKLDQCFKRMEDEWRPKLIAEGAASLPTSREEFVNLVLSHPNYKDKEIREQERIAEMNARAEPPSA